MSLFFKTPQEMTEHIAKLAQAKRLSLNLSKKTLSEHSAVRFGVIKKFERTGKISLESLLKIALSLGALEDFKDVFKLTPPEHLGSLDEILKDKKRKRGGSDFSKRICYSSLLRKRFGKTGPGANGFEGSKNFF